MCQWDVRDPAAPEPVASGTVAETIPLPPPRPQPKSGAKAQPGRKL
jgi:hypothetical protein